MTSRISTTAKTACQCATRRTYATAAIPLEQITDFATPKAPRRFPSYKAHLYSAYLNLLKDSSLVLFLQHNNLTVSEFRQVRKILKDAAAEPRLEVLNVGILSAVFKGLSGVKETPEAKFTQTSNPNLVKLVPSLRPLCVGPLCAITFTDLVPANIKKVAEICQGSKDKLMLLGALANDRVLDVDSLKTVSKLPGLEVLRAEIAGLIGLPSMVLLSVLERSRGAELSLVLEGLKQNLEKEATKS